VLTDNCVQFIDPTGNPWSPAEIEAMLEKKQPFRAHSLDSSWHARKMTSTIALPNPNVPGPAVRSSE
jgi:hypothetical protein